MKKIGEILVEKGALSVSELTAGLDATRRDGGKLGTHLVRLGFVDEYLLLEALSEQFQVPSVSAQVLRRSHAKVRRLLPSAVASELLAVPFLHQGEHLKVGSCVFPRIPVFADFVDPDIETGFHLVKQ